MRFVGELPLDGACVTWGHSTPRIPRARKGSSASTPRRTPAGGAVPDIEVIPVRSLGHLVEHLYELQPIPAYVRGEINSIPPDLMG